MPTAPSRPMVDSRWLTAIAELDEEALRGLLARRPDVVASRPESLHQVAACIVTNQSAKFFFDRTDRSTQHFLEALCALEPSTLPALAGALGCGPGELSPIVENLRVAGMVLVDADLAYANPGLAGVIPFPCRLGPPAAGLLGRLANSELAQIARHLDLPTTGAKAELVRRVTRGISEAERIRDLIDEAPASTAELIAMAAHEWPQFQLSAGTAHAAHQQHSAPGWCLRHGFLVATGWGTAVMPRETALALRGGCLFSSFQPGSPAVKGRPVDPDQVDRRAAEIALRLVEDVEKICDAWSATPAKVLQNGGIGTREIRRAAKLVGRDEPVTARLIELAGAAGLVGTNEGGETASPTPGYDSWAVAGSEVRWRALAVAWLNACFEVGLAGTRDEDGKAVAPLAVGLEPDQLVRRALVLDLMATHPGEALDAASAEAVVVWRRPAAWAADAGETSQIVQALLEEAHLTGVASQLDDQYALSGFGRLLVDGDAGGAEKYLGSLVPPMVDEVVLQADFTATVAGHPAPELRAELDLMADVESTGHATVWRISEATVRRAFDAGRDAAQVLGFLRQHAVHGVPQPLSYLVEDIGRRHGRVRTGPAACFVRSDDPALLSELALAKKTSRLGLRLVAPTVAVSARSVQEVTDALRAAGYLPAIEGPEGEIVPQRPVAHRAKALPWANGSAEDLFAGLEDLDDEDRELLGEMMSDPDLVAELTGLPPELALMMVQLASEDPGISTSSDDLATLAARLRQAPFVRQQETTKPGKATQAPAHKEPQPPQLFDVVPGRPWHIAKGVVEMSELLQEALESGWAVRMGYVNGRGTEREFFAKVLDLNRSRVRVRYLDQHGGGELNLRQVQWARVLTDAEEEMLG